jgi:hypothetical protein
MIQPLRFTSITETSTLLRVCLPLCPESELSFLWVLHLRFSLIIGMTGSRVPHKSLVQVDATFVPDAAQALTVFPWTPPGVVLAPSFDIVVTCFRHLFSSSLVLVSLNLS